MNGDKKYTSPQRADYYVKSGRAEFDEKKRLVFKELGRLITQHKQRAEEYTVGNANGYEWQGANSGKEGPRVMQLTPLRDKGIRAIQERLGLTPRPEPESK